MIIDKVKVKCTDNGREVEATLLSKNDDAITVFMAENRVTLVKRNGVYVGNKLGMEFTSSGKVVR